MSASAPSAFSFAQLSDPHLTSLEAVHWQQLLNKRALGYLSWRRKRRFEHRGEVLDALLADLDQTAPEHIVITGDLTHLGLPDEFRQARLWLDRLGVSERITVVPGNHDAYAPASWASTFSLWEPYMRSDTPFPEQGAGAAEAVFPSLRIRDGVALIGLSSARATAPFLATGSLGSRQIERLTDILRQTGGEGLFRVVLLHHPPRVEDEKWRKRLTDGRALCRALEDAGAELVLHGHGHRAHRSEIGGGERRIPVFGIPSASAIGRRHGRRAQYYLYRIARQAPGWSVQVQVRGYQPATGSFRLEHEHHLSVPVISSTSL
jgi:3',5'-cyclic AMP phosphodiesterase CpdA